MGNIAEQCKVGLFQNSDFAGDLEDSKSTSGRLLFIFWKSYTCSNKLDVQETNCCFSQLNRIWNHLPGHRTEIGFLVFQIDRGNLRVMNANTTNLTTKSMWRKTLMLFLQMSNPRVKNLYCMCLRTMKLWSRWSLKAEVLQWDTSPGLTELLLICCAN